MGFDVSALSEDLIDGAKIILSEYGLLDGAIRLEGVQGDMFLVESDGNSVRICYTRKVEFFRGLGYAIAKIGETFRISETCAFKEYGYMVDLSRNGVMKEDTVKKNIRMLALLGYTDIQLYTEETYEIDGEPYFGYLRGRLQQAQIKRMNDYANIFGIALVPCIQTLGHLSRMMRWRAYYPVCEGYDVLLPDDEKTYALIDKMFATLRKCFTTDKVNICMDEAASLGRCVYWDKNGPITDRLEIFVKHLNRVNEIAKKYGFHYPMMWSDMFLNINEDVEVFRGNKLVDEKIRKQVPENVTLVHWCYAYTPYLENMIKSHRTFNRDFCYAGAVRRYCSHAPHNSSSVYNLGLQIDVCKKTGVEKFLLTNWGDGGNECSYFAGLPAMYVSIEYAYGNERPSVEDKFAKLFGVSLSDMFLLDSANMHKGYEQQWTVRAEYNLYGPYLLSPYTRQSRIGDEREYLEHVTALEKARDNAGEWAYIFDTQVTLCKLLSYKLTLPLKTKNLYQAQDKKGLKKLIKTDYIPLKKLYAEFRDKSFTQWYKECNPHGFDAIEQRLGGMIFQTQSVINRLNDYIHGRIDKIEELEVETLPLSGNPEKDYLPYHENEFTKIYSQYKI